MGRSASVSVSSAFYCVLHTGRKFAWRTVWYYWQRSRWQWQFGGTFILVVLFSLEVPLWTMAGRWGYLMRRCMQRVGKKDLSWPSIGCKWIETSRKWPTEHAESEHMFLMIFVPGFLLMTVFLLTASSWEGLMMWNLLLVYFSHCFFLFFL